VRLGKSETILDVIARGKAVVAELIQKRSNLASQPFPPAFAKQRLREIYDQVAA
jgi:hypothetical protein